MKLIQEPSLAIAVAGFGFQTAERFELFEVEANLEQYVAASPCITQVVYRGGYVRSFAIMLIVTLPQFASGALKSCIAAASAAPAKPVLVAKERDEAFRVRKKS